MLIPMFGCLFITSAILGVMFADQPKIFLSTLAFAHIVIWCAVGALQEWNITDEQ